MRNRERQRVLALFIGVVMFVLSFGSCLLPGEVQAAGSAAAELKQTYSQTRTELKSVLDVVEALKPEDYTPETYQQLAAAIAEAKQLYQSEEADEQEMKEKIERLHSLAKNLKSASEAEYERLVQELENKKEELGNSQNQMASLEEEVRRLAEEAVRMRAALEQSEKEAAKMREELQKLQRGTLLKKGDTTEANGVKYRVTDVGEKLAEAYGVSDKNRETVKVADTVTINGGICKVTAVADKAFSGMKKLKKAEIGKNITSVGKKVFYKDNKLARITVKSTALEKVGAQALKGISAKAVIKVPKAKKKAYTRLFKGKGQKKSVKVK
ncbi:leucine-rich repeat protein [Lachnospiraceae bacterium 46-15]